MRHIRLGPAILLRLETGDEIFSSVTELARAEGIGAASLSGIGAAYGVVLGYYDRRTKEYTRTTVEEEVEIVSLVGNIALKDGQPFPHMHVTISGRDFRTMAGHLFEGRTGGTVEVVITPLAGFVHRRKDDATGLFLLDV